MLPLDPMTCLVVDDEPLAVELMAGYVRRTPHLVLAGTATDPFAAVKRIEEGGVDLLITDIRMTGLSGLQLIKLADRRCACVVISAHAEHAIDGFELDVIDYLQKPVRYERFLVAIEKVKARSAPIVTTPPADHFFLKSGHEVVRLRHDEVLYISAMRDYVSVHTAERGRFLSLENLRDLKERLPVDRFCRIHRSHMVALHAINRVERDQVTIGGTHLPISDTYARNFRTKLGV